MATNGIILNARDVGVIAQLEARVKALEARADKVAPVKPIREIRFGRITGATAEATLDAAGNPVAWRYDLVEVVKTSAGYSASTATSKWVTNSSGFATTSTTRAYHFSEDMNDGSGVQSTGLDHDPEDIVMQPIPTGHIVAFFFVPVTSELTECWFFPLGVNGEDCA